MHHAGLSKHDDSATGFMDYSKYGYANFRKDYAYDRYPSFYSPCSERDNQCTIDSAQWEKFKGYMFGFCILVFIFGCIVRKQGNDRHNGQDFLSFVVKHRRPEKLH